MNDETPRHSATYRLLILVGGVPLLFTMLIDTLAVLGRWLRSPLHGSIEMAQFALLISGSVAILVATLAGTHVVVRLLLDRLREPARTTLQRGNFMFSALYFLALLVGGVWIAVDMWPGFEQSELLGLPFRPLRVIANLTVAMICLVFVRRAFLRMPK